MVDANKEMGQPKVKKGSRRAYYNGAAIFLGCVVLIAILLGGYYALSNKTPELSKELADIGVISTDFSTFKKDYEAKTVLQKDDYWKATKWKLVQWSGKVIDASDNQVTIESNKNLISVKFPDDSKTNLLNVNKGDRLTVRGKLSELGDDSFSSWELVDAEIIK